MEENQTLKQKKIALAQSEHAGVVVELMKDVMQKTQIVADTEWQTIVNAITLEVQSTMMRDVVDYIEKVRSGILHDNG
jgi:hypothetical protein